MNHTIIAFIWGGGCYCLAVTNNFQLDQQKNEWDWCSIKVIASKNMSWVNSYKNYIYSEKKDFSSLAVTNDIWLNQQKMNESDAVWRWVHKNYSWI